MDEKNNKILDDIAKLTGDALGAIGSFKTEVETIFKNKFEQYLDRMNFISKDEMDIMRETIQKMRIEQEKLSHRLAQLEAEIKQDAPKDQ